jgi:hypothetical protein
MLSVRDVWAVAVDSAPEAMNSGMPSTFAIVAAAAVLVSRDPKPTAKSPSVPPSHETKNVFDPTESTTVLAVPVELVCATLKKEEAMTVQRLGAAENVTTTSAVTAAGFGKPKAQIVFVSVAAV